MKNKSDRIFIITIIVCATLTISLIAGGIIYSVNQDKKFDEWYNSLTPEEQIQYQQEQAEKREKMKERYEIMSVSQYVGTNTNNFGGITNTYVAYTFTYMKNGQLCHIEKFIHYDNGNTKVVIDDKDEYVVDKYDNTQDLVLTKETLATLKVNQ
jgi:flagellar basal body-associated protein FliL